MGGEDDRWRDCCTLFLLDAEKDKETGRKIKIPGLKTKLYPYQLLGAFATFENEVIQGGGYLADGMGMGKVRWSIADTSL